MITNWFTLQKCADYFNGQYTNAVLERCFTYEKNELWLQFRDLPPLKVHLGQPFQFILQASAPMQIKKDSVRIFPLLEGTIVENITMLPAERIMRFHFTNGSDLFILFLSNRGNVVYQQEDKTEYFKKKVTVEPELLQEQKAQTYSSLEEDPRFSPYWKRNAVDIFGTDSYDLILKTIESSKGQELSGRFVLCATEGAYTSDEFYSNYRKFVVTHLSEGQFHQEFKNIQGLLSKKLNDIQRKLQDTKDDGKMEKRADKYRFFADTLSACRHMISPHSELFDIPDMYQNELFPAKITLKKAPSITENIDDYYKKARNAETRIEENRHRHQELRIDYKTWEAYYKSFEVIKDYRALRDWKKTHANVLKQAGRAASTDQERRPYREVVTKDNWRIWIGRSARDNDDMTFKHAVKTDIWLHTRHSTGSHVIIKKDGKKDVPKHIIEHAAALAARYSDEKHSSLVTVVSAERKYVTKRKGMPPGKVHFQYEKDLMVKPEEI
jgi:predicted ribosome quality control (RQC) complex YloA/Tae2 family protein